MDFWDKFYSLCDSKKTKPNTVAKQLGFSSALCTQWKKRLQKPSYEKASKIAEHFDVPVDYLLNDEINNIVSPEIKNNTPVKIDKSVMNDIFKVFSSSEVDKLSSLSRDQATEVVKLVDEFLSK